MYLFKQTTNLSDKESATTWRKIIGYEKSYLINEVGIILSQNPKHLNRILTPRIDRAGYYTIRLSMNGVTKTKYLHRVLAENFISNPYSKAYVNHLNGNKLDNRLINLEWSTHSENIKHAYKTGLLKKKGSLVIDSHTGKMFVSAKEASEALGINHSTLRGYLNGGIKINPTLLEYQKN